MAIKPIRLAEAQLARKLARRNLSLAQQLNREKDYYDWTIVVLFYSACALVVAICNIEGVSIPEQHRGRYDLRTRKYIDGMIDKAKKYLSKKSYESYSNLLVWSGVFRYNPKYIFKFQENPRTPEIVKNFFIVSN